MIRTLLSISIIAAFAAATTSCSEKRLTASAHRATLQGATTHRVGRTSIADTYEATGTVSARTTTQLAANVLGRIVSISVGEGDSVRKGQPLVELDAREAQTQLDKAEAALREAQASLIELEASIEAANAAVKTSETNKRLADVTIARYRELYAHRSISAQEFDEAVWRASTAGSELDRAKANSETVRSKKEQLNARISQAKAEIANARVNASFTRIVSPVSGVIVKKLVEPGAIASPGVPLLSIEDNSQHRLEAVVGESHSTLVQLGHRVTVRIDALGQNEMSGTVAEILPTSDAASRSYKVKIVLPPHPLLRSGLFGIARFTLSVKKAITVPETSLIQRGQLTGVYIVDREGAALFRIVTTGATSEGMVEILSGLSEGDDVVSDQADKLKDGTKIR